MNKKDFNKLPKWLQELWNISPKLARKAEKQLFKEKTEKDLIKLAEKLNFEINYSISNFKTIIILAKEMRKN